jgi:hypothetical protein
MTFDGVVVVVVVGDVVVVTAVVDVDDVDDVELVDEDVDGGDVEVVTNVVAVGSLELDGSDELVCVLEAQASSNGGANKRTNHNDRREVMKPSRSTECDHDAAVAVGDPLALDDSADGATDFADRHHHPVLGLDLDADAFELGAGYQFGGRLGR